MIETAKQFWKSQNTYPDYGFIKERRLHELNHLMPFLDGVNSVLDLGCGDGALIKCLRELTDIETYYAYDIASNLMKDIPAITENYDCANPSKLPIVDITIMSGLLPYLEDEHIHNLLPLIQSDKIYIRTPCADERTEVNTYSEKLKANYSSIYRTTFEIEDILSQYFKVEEIIRAYPDEIESEFGTKQFIFMCERPFNIREINGVVMKTSKNFFVEKLSEIQDPQKTLIKGSKSMEGEWFVSDGTALGLHRDKDFIPYDTDIDVSVKATKDQKHIKIKGMKLIQIQEWKGRPIQTCYKDKNGCIFDIFYYYDDIVKEKLATVCDNGIVAISNFEIKNQDTKYGQIPLPHPIEDYLKERYSDWEIPKNIKGNYYKQ